MSAIVTDQFRILNANNFVESVENTNNSYYVFVGLANPQGASTLWWVMEDQGIGTQILLHP